jgi:hypothetical protein
MALEESVHALISSGWEERQRKQAYDMAMAIAQGAKASGCKETAGVLDAITSLLAMPLAEVIPLRDELRDKLLELLDLLREDPLAQTA